MANQFNRIAAVEAKDALSAGRERGLLEPQRCRQLRHAVQQVFRSLVDEDGVAASSHGLAVKENCLAANARDIVQGPLGDRADGCFGGIAEAVVEMQVENVFRQHIDCCRRGLRRAIGEHDGQANTFKARVLIGVRDAKAVRGSSVAKIPNIVRDRAGTSWRKSAVKHIGHHVRHASMIDRDDGFLRRIQPDRAYVMQDAERVWRKAVLGQKRRPGIAEQVADVGIRIGVGNRRGDVVARDRSGRGQVHKPHRDVAGDNRANRPVGLNQRQNPVLRIGHNRVQADRRAGYVGNPDALRRANRDDIALDQEVARDERVTASKPRRHALHENPLHIVARSLNQHIVPDRDIFHVARRIVVEDLDHVRVIAKVLRRVERANMIALDQHVVDCADQNAVRADVVDVVATQRDAVAFAGADAGFQIVELIARDHDLA